MYEIEKGLHAPSFRGRKPKYPWSRMEIGDSFFVPLSEDKTARLVAVRVRNSGYEILGKGACKVHIVTENGVEGVRAWRIK